MNKTLALIGVILAMAVINLNAQTTNLSDITKSPEVKAALISFAQLSISNKSVTVAVYPTYASGIVVDGKKDVWGGGIALLTPVASIPGVGTVVGDGALAQHLFAGLRFDVLAHQFYVSTLAVGFKGDMQVAGHNFTGFIHTGGNIPLGAEGSGSSGGGMYGGGVITTLFKFGKTDASGVRAGSVDIFIAAEKWTQYSGQVFHPGLDVTWHF